MKKHIHLLRFHKKELVKNHSNNNIIIILLLLLLLFSQYFLQFIKCK